MKTLRNAWAFYPCFTWAAPEHQLARRPHPVPSPQDFCRWDPGAEIIFFKRPGGPTVQRAVTRGSW